MRRRTVLLSLGAATSPLLTGCLGSRHGSGDDTPEPTTNTPAATTTITPQHSRLAGFDRCPRLVIGIDTLPEPARREVETALSEGQYDTTGELALPRLLDPTQSYLARGDTYYQATIHERETGQRLELTAATPSKGRHPITIDNRDGQRAVDLTITYLDGETPLLTASRSLAADEQVTLRTVDRKLGEYRAEIETSQVSKTLTWREDEHKEPLETIVVTDDDAYYEPQAVAELVQCADVWGTETETGSADS